MQVSIVPFNFHPFVLSWSFVLSFSLACFKRTIMAEDNTVQMVLTKTRSADSAALPPRDPRPDDLNTLDPFTAQDEAPVKRNKFRLAAIVGALYLSLFLAALDATIVSTAIPTISAHFQSASGYTWIGGAYLLANAATGPIWAKLSD